MPMPRGRSQCTFPAKIFFFGGDCGFVGPRIGDLIVIGSLTEAAGCPVRLCPCPVRRCGIGEGEFGKPAVGGRGTGKLVLRIAVVLERGGSEASSPPDSQSSSVGRLSRPV